MILRPVRRASRRVPSRVRTAAAAMIVAGTALAGAGVANAAPDTAAQHCLADGPITAASYQSLFDGWHDAAFSGADQTYSMQLPDGRSLWLFADTEQGSMTRAGARGADRRYVHNSIMMWDGRCAHMVDPGTHAAVMPGDSDGSFYWSSVAGIDNGDLQVFTLRTHGTGGGVMDFQTDGTALFTFHLPPNGDPVLVRKQPIPGDGLWQWGAAITADQDYVYVYATAASTQPFVFGKDVRVARAPKGSLANFATWQYWAGGSWSPSLQDAVTVLPAEQGPSSTFSVLQHPDGSWELISKQYDMLGDYVAAWSAPTPAGPWTLANPQVLAAPSYVTTPNTLLYNGLAHPEVQLASGQLLVSVNRNTLSSAEFMGNANAYMPQFFEVDPGAVGGTLSPVIWPSPTAPAVPTQPVGWGAARLAAASPGDVTPGRATGSWGAARRR